MTKLDAAYRETDKFTKTYYCDIYDTAPATPGGLSRWEVNEFHDKVPYKTGFAICGKLEYGCGYFKKRYNAYERSLKNLSHCLCAQLRHQNQNFGYQSEDGWVYLDSVCHFVNR